MKNRKKAPPSWATVVGILGICFGVLGLAGGSYEIMMPTMLSMQERMVEKMKEAARESANRPPCPDDENKAHPNVPPEKLFDVMEEFMTVPPWHSRFAYGNGSLQLLLGALYILCSIFLLLAKRGAVPFFLSIATLSAVRNVIALIISIYMVSFVALWTLITSACGFLIDLVIIIVVISSSRAEHTQGLS